MAHLQLLVADRRRGKTTQAFAWVSQGVPVPGYPGWSRVLLIPTLQRFWTHRRTFWSKLEDYDHRVYHMDEWAYAIGVRGDTEVCIDDLDYILRDGVGQIPGLIVAATITAQPWETIEPKWDKTDA